MSKRKKGAQPKTRFSVGTNVRVKAGITDPDFDDIPIGGWLGTIRKIEPEANPPTYLIRWHPQTLDNMHPVYRKRCERDDLEIEEMWLGEDALESDSGGPIKMEQPTEIRSRPLDMDIEEDRIRAIFGLTSNDPLPDVDDQSLARYHAFLSSRLSFPIDGTIVEESGPSSTRKQAVSLIGIRPIDEIDDEYGLICDAKREHEVVQLPLAKVEPKKGNPNLQLVDDYLYWFVNWS